MRYAGASGRYRATEANLYRTVQMTTQDALYLRMAPHHLRQSLRFGQTNLVHVTDAGLEGWMVHDNDGWSLWLLREHLIQPVQRG